MFSLPRKYTRRKPPVKYMCAIERSAFSVRSTPSALPRALATRSRSAATASSVCPSVCVSP